jgi:hypothetical protein
MIWSNACCATSKLCHGLTVSASERGRSALQAEVAAISTAMRNRRAIVRAMHDRSAGTGA